MMTTTLPNGVLGTSSYDNANRLTGVSWGQGRHDAGIGQLHARQRR